MSHESNLSIKLLYILYVHIFRCNCNLENAFKLSTLRSF